MSDQAALVVAERPTTGTPRPYDFPHVERSTLANGLRVAVAAMPGRQLISASLVVRHGAADEPDAIAGASVLAARAFTEGTQSYDAIQLTEAAERLGASIHAEAGWDAGSISVDVPAARFDAALELLAEVARRPTFPAVEIERLRDERLNDLLQARADPRRRAEEAFVGTIYAGSSPYRRPAGGTKDTVEHLDRDAIVEIVAASHDPARMALIVGGEIDVDTVVRAVERLFGDWQAEGATPTRTPDDASAVTKRVRQGRPSTGGGPDGDPRGAPGRAAPASGLPRDLGHERDPGWPVQLPAEHEAPRGEGLHLRRECGLRHAACRVGRSRRERR